jgi:hypothetical protein
MQERTPLVHTSIVVVVVSASHYKSPKKLPPVVLPAKYWMLYVSKSIGSPGMIQQKS